MCTKCVDYHRGLCTAILYIKIGRTNAGVQRYRCKNCGKTFVQQYTYREYRPCTNPWITSLLTEGCGIRSIARLLAISITTVLKRILQIGTVACSATCGIGKPAMTLHKQYEIDELRTFYKSKDRLLWVMCALKKDTGAVIDFAIGSRTLKTLKGVTDTVLLAGVQQVYTDKLGLYKCLLPHDIHCTKKYGINRLERKHLSMRTHLKCLGRRTICISKSLTMLEACVKIYFWGKA